MARTMGQAIQNVQVIDDMTAALEAAASHAASFYAAGRSTLIDQISQADWDAWDASDERALISDPDGIDLQDQSDCYLAA